VAGYWPRAADPKVGLKIVRLSYQRAHRYTRGERARDGCHGHCKQWRREWPESGGYETTITPRKRGSETPDVSQRVTLCRYAVRMEQQNPGEISS